MQFNILADELAYDFPKVPEEYLKWDYRLPLILRHMLQFECDIICTEENDHADQILEKLVAASGRPYKMIFEKKKQEAHKDGTAIYYDSAKITLEESHAHFYENTGSSLNRFFLAALFKTAVFSESHSIPETFFMVAATHLKAKKYEQVRLLEVDQLLSETDKLERTWASKLSVEQNVRVGERVPFIVCGDFNSHPHTEPIRKMM